MKLIEYSNYQIKVADEAFLVKPIRTLFNKDKSKTKDNFWSQMSYMYFLVDPRSSYMYIVDEEERAKEIIKQEGLPEDFTPSKELLAAMDIYKKTTQTSSSLLLEDTRLAIDKLRQFLKDVDLNKCDDKGKPVYQDVNLDKQGTEEKSTFTDTTTHAYEEENGVKVDTSLGYRRITFEDL